MAFRELHGSVDNELRASSGGSMGINFSEELTDTYGNLGPGQIEEFAIISNPMEDLTRFAFSGIQIGSTSLFPFDHYTIFFTVVALEAHENTIRVGSF